MPLKLFLAATALVAVAVGLLLPTPGGRDAPADDRAPISQIPTIHVGPG